EIPFWGLKLLSLHVATSVAAAVMILSLAYVVLRLETIPTALEFLGIVTLFGVAAICQTGDRPGGRLFRPGALVQAHAMWHILAAVTFVWAIKLLDRAGVIAARATVETR